MKNPFRTDPTQLKKRKESNSAIFCDIDAGPAFGNDIWIGSHNNSSIKCWINNDGTHQYECNPRYGKKFFVNVSSIYESNCVSVPYYEVFYQDNYKDYIYKKCKYPDIILNYMKNKTIEKDIINEVASKEEILKDLELIKCSDYKLRAMISQLCLNNPSEFLPKTTIVEKKYDNILKEWIGDEYKLKLLYRASEHEYKPISFHECCDDKGPTLTIIKSTEGWIFGGYTTQSWLYPYDIICICYNMIDKSQ